MEAIYRRPNTSKPAPGHRTRSTRSEQTSPIPMAQPGGHHGLAPGTYWRKLSKTMDAGFCVAALEEAFPGTAGDIQHRPGESVHQ